MALRMCVAVALLIAGMAQAAPVYGTAAPLGAASRTEGAGVLVTGGEWFGDSLNLTIGWTVTDLGGGNFHYRYEIDNFTSQKAGLSHFILDLSDSCTNTSGCVANFVSSLVVGSIDYDTFNPGPDNPGMPAAITGIKFDAIDDDESRPVIFEFDSNRAPMWGDFYMKGARESFAYNVGLADHTSENPSHFIVVPDTTNSVVPEPISLALMGAGLLALPLLKRLRRS